MSKPTRQLNLTFPPEVLPLVTTPLIDVSIKTSVKPKPTITKPSGITYPSRLVTAEPVLKWAGGKRQLFSQYEKLFPNNIEVYAEPFLGGGAVYFGLMYSHRRLVDGARVYLSDANEELINLYRILQNNPEALIQELASSEYRNDKDTYLKIRALKRPGDIPKDPIKKAARTIYLNRTCFNGLYRKNNRGEFNVPFAGYKNPTIRNIPRLQAASSAFQGAQLLTGDFSAILNVLPDKHTRPSQVFVFLDPPYWPVSETASFTKYHEGFGPLDQLRTKVLFEDLSERGYKVMLSNSDVPEVRYLFEDYRIETVLASRNINCKGNKRQKVNEVLVMNF